MGLHAGRLVLLFLCLFSLSSLAGAASFSDCFPSGPLVRFWQDTSYVSSNPNIITIWSIHSYAFAFDNSTTSLGLENISLMNGSALLARVPAGQRAALSEPAALLTQASGEIELAKEAVRSSHELSAKAQTAVRDNFGLLNVPLTNIFFLTIWVHLDILLKVTDVSQFISIYPMQYSSALLHASSAHDELQSAALSLSRLAQTEYEFLSSAGAGSKNYSGAASSTFNYAESLLAPSGGFCENEAGAYQKAYDYFASSPQLPDFSQAGLPQRLNALGGIGENSSIARTLSLYLLLSDAKGKMLSEYATARLSAQDSLRALSTELAFLGSEKLELIGDAPFHGAGGTSLTVGSGYGGIYSGYLSAKEDASRAQAIISSSEASFSSKGADGWLSQAISEMQSSSELSQTATASLRLVRSNAEAAVLLQKKAAEDAIALAQQSTNASASSLASAQSLSSARSLLLQAEDALSAAGSLPSLGARFVAYTDAARLADRAYALSQSQHAEGALMDAEQALASYASIISSAQADGIDTAYERETLAQYRALLLSSPAPDIISSVISSVQSQQDALLLRVYESYSYLEEKYARASELTGAMRASFPTLSQQLYTLSRYFPSGTLDAQAAAGHLKQAERSLDSILASAEQQAPQYLSSALSQHSHVSEIYATPVLGRQADYTAYVTTQNPSPLSSSSAISFSVRTAVPLYSTDYSGGDPITDAYPDKGKTAILLPGVEPHQELSFTFEKPDQPAQIISTDDACSFATEENAQASREISFISSRALPSLAVSQSVPLLSSGATVKYGGQTFPLSSLSSGDEDILQGEISGVASGKGELTLSYSVWHPFTSSLSTREYETLPLGAKNVSYTLSLSSSSLACPSATVSIYEPFSGISNLTITPLTGEKVVRAAAAQSGEETQISLTFSPLAKGKDSSFFITYSISDTSQALSDALSQAELLVLTYNRTKDALMLSEAKRLASAGDSNGALSLLSQMRKDAQELSYSAGDYALFLQEKSGAGSALSSMQQIQNSLALANSSSQTAFSSALFKYQSSLASASDEADSGGYQKAVTILRKAKSDLLSSIAVLSLSSLTSASEKYAAARKMEAGNSTLLSAAQGELADAQSYYTQGDFAQSLLHSSSALSILSSLVQASSEDASALSTQAESLRSDYAALRAEVEPLLANYSSQYSSLSTQSRRQLPFTPSTATARLSEADKLIEASKKATLTPQDALFQANSSLAKLSSLHASLSSALSSLADSAHSSLDVARAALTEVKSRGGADDAKQIGDEVARAEGFLSSAMYADSLASSDRAISAANAALSKVGAGGNPLQPIALGLISVVFLAGAAYYFFTGRKRAPPSEKKEVPKAE